MLGPPLHPSHHLQTDSPLYPEDARMSSPPSPPLPADGALPHFAGDELCPCLRLQAGYADSTQTTPKNLIVLIVMFIVTVLILPSLSGRTTNHKLYKLIN